MRPVFENPFSSQELQDLFEKQHEKVDIEVKKEVKETSGRKKWTLTVHGHRIGNRYFDIWHDDYIVSFDAHTNDEGHGYAKNRFPSVEALKKEVFTAFNLTEPAQMTFF